MSEPVRFVLKDVNEPGCHLGVGWLEPAPGWRQHGTYWFALVDDANTVLDSGGADGSFPEIADLIQATRFLIDWQKHKPVLEKLLLAERVHTESLREAALAHRPQDVQDLVRSLAA